MNTADAITFLRRLRAIRQFRAGAIPAAARDDILDVARWTGTAKNRQAWELVWIERPETLRAVGAVEGYAKHVAGAAAAVAIVMSGDVVWEEQDVFDEGRLSERIMLAAAAHGIAGCVGWVDGDGIEAAKQLLGIPREKRLRTFVSLGYAAEQAQPARPGHGGRKPLAELVSYERYGRQSRS
jgi:nitroreductase